MTSPIMKHFHSGHLSKHLQLISDPLCQIAEALDATLPDGPEKSAGLRKLLEAKDCFIRSRLDDLSGDLEVRCTVTWGPASKGNLVSVCENSAYRQGGSSAR